MRVYACVLLLMLSACGGDGEESANSDCSKVAGAASSSIPASDTVIPQAGRPIVFIGDSITMLWPLDHYLSGAIDAGISGNETGQMLARFQTDVLSHNPATVVILGGINDIKNSTDVDLSVVASHIFEMVQATQSAGARAIVGTVTPATCVPDVTLDNQRIAQLNQLIATGKQQYGYEIVDYHAVTTLPDGDINRDDFVDGLHPNTAGYDAMWGALKSVLSP